jgi:ATP-dependent DNA ligase
VHSVPARGPDAGSPEKAKPARSCIIGEAVACGDDGIARFDRIRYRRHDPTVFLYAFDLIELSGEELRRNPLDVRKATLASLLARTALGIRFNDHMEGGGWSYRVPACLQAGP